MEFKSWGKANSIDVKWECWNRRNDGMFQID